MAHRIEVASAINTEGARLSSALERDLSIRADVNVIDVYTIDGDPSSAELHRLGAELFADPVTQHYSIDAPLAVEPSGVVEIGFWPGVTDNTGNTATAAQRDLLGTAHPTYTSRQYVFRGNATMAELERIAQYLANPVIQRWEIRTREEWKRNPIGIYVPRVALHGEPTVTFVDLASMGDEELEKTGRLGILDGYDEKGGEIRRGSLSTSLDEMKVIQRHYPQIRDAELESVAQTQSEHCKHKIFNGRILHTEGGRTETIDSLFRTYIKGATDAVRKRSKTWDKRLVSVFSDNAGIVDSGNGYYIALKVETHNSPSALDPYGGALTGIVGVNRDIIGVGIGARPIFNTDVFCFADPEYKGELPFQILKDGTVRYVMHPKRVELGVHKGVEHGGNKSGIPTVNGSIRHDSYPFGSVIAEGVEGKPIQSNMGKPLVYCGTGGIMPAEINGRPSHYKKADTGDMIVMVGGRIGKDGIHGATFSSEALHSGSPAGAVQIGDPITQKRMLDFLLEARDRGLYKSITDNGAGGLSCSVGEMSRESGGAELHLDKAPLKYAGLQPWEILISESQERMTLAVHPDKIGEFIDLARRRGVEASVLGTFNESGRFRVYYESATVADLDMDFLHNGLPQKKMKSVWREPNYKEPTFVQPDIDWALMKLLARPNIASKEFFVRQYDHEVQGGTVVKPFTGVRNDGPSDAAVVWPVEFRRKGNFSGLVVSNGINPNYGLIDPYRMAAANIDESIRNAVATGADPDFIAVLDNFCWSSSDDPHRLGQLVRAAKGCYDSAVAFGTPFISGKDSMYNDYSGKINGKDVKISVPPTLLISALGRIPDVRQAVTMDMKKPKNLLYVVNVTRPELGGSEYYAMLGAERGEAWVGRSVPKVDAKTASRAYQKLHSAIRNGIVYSAHDASEGGLLVALAESAFAGGLGAEVYFERVPAAAGIGRDDHLAFSESQSRLIVEVPEHRAAAFERYMKGVPYAAIGRTTSGDGLAVYGLTGKQVMNTHLQDLKDAWQKTFRW